MTIRDLFKCHVWTPWVQERWKPSLDTRVCRQCKTYEKRHHVDGCEMFPEWLLRLEEERND